MADAKPPKRIYLEVWPENANRETLAHDAPVGFGVDVASGACSTIYVYERVSRERLRQERRKRARR